jgi:hypothetical protein
MVKTLSSGPKGGKFTFRYDTDEVALLRDPAQTD